MGARLSGSDRGDTLGCVAAVGFIVVAVLLIAVVVRLAYQYGGSFAAWATGIVLSLAVVTATAVVVTEGGES